MNEKHVGDVGQHGETEPDFSSVLDVVGGHLAHHEADQCVRGGVQGNPTFVRRSGEAVGLSIRLCRPLQRRFGKQRRRKQKEEAGM